MKGFIFGCFNHTVTFYEPTRLETMSLMHFVREKARRKYLKIVYLFSMIKFNHHTSVLKLHDYIFHIYLRLFTNKCINFV